MSQEVDSLKRLLADHPDLLESLAGGTDIEEVARRAAEIARQHGIGADGEKIKTALKLLTDEELAKVAGGGEFPWSFARPGLKW